MTNCTNYSSSKFQKYPKISGFAKSVFFLNFKILFDISNFHIPIKNIFQQRRAKRKKSQDEQLVPHHALLVDFALLHRVVGHHRPHAGHVIIVLSLVTLRVILLDTSQITNPCLLVERPLKRGKGVELLHADVPGLLLRLALFHTVFLLFGQCFFLVVNGNSDHRLARIRVLITFEQTTLKNCAFLFQ